MTSRFKLAKKVEKLGQLMHYKKNPTELHASKFPRHRVGEYKSPVVAWSSEVVISHNDGETVKEVKYTDGKKSKNTS